MANEEKLISALKSRGYTLSAGESCTGGLFVSGLIGISGASDVIGASFVTYSEAAKRRILGVKQETLARYGVVSEQVAAEMASGAARAGGADIGVGITGYADGSAGEALAGVVCFGFYIRGFVTTVRVKFDGSRNVVRKLAADFAVLSVIKLL